MSKSFAHFSHPAVDPRAPSAYRDGLRVRLGLRAPNAMRSAVSALIGTELVYNRTEGEARTTTLAGTAGIGLNFGPARRGTIDFRYTDLRNIGIFARYPADTSRWNSKTAA